MSQYNITLKQYRLSGKVVYEYNPFRNFRDSDGKLQDFVTDKLNFDLEHPVHIECLSSYDGSVNLILNDGINPTRLINSRFSVRQNNTYKIEDRTGNSDTNIYDDSLFDTDTSLRKRINTIPKLSFMGLTYGGNLPVGNYNFYFKYCDADGNETDFIAESGNVVCHVGNLNDPKSIRSGLESENSGKIVQFSMRNLDKAYDYIKVWYSRLTSSAHNEPVIEYKQIVKKFKCKGGVCQISITGFEETLTSTLEEVNKEYFTASIAKSSAQCKNRLFLANLTKSEINYEDFVDISLRMLPKLDDTAKVSEETTDTGWNPKLDKDYKTKDGDCLYYDVMNIYNKVGYWSEELYRLGVVYIFSDDSLSPVFNIRGCNNLDTNTEYFTSTEQIQYNYETGLISEGRADLENAKGVIRIKLGDYQNYILGIKVTVESDVLTRLKELKVKGFFFVRLKRIPTILAQAFVIGHDPVSGVPLITKSTENGYKYYTESFTDKYGLIELNYEEHLVEVPNGVNQAALCPDYSLRQEMYNNFFTDTDFVVKEVVLCEIEMDNYNNRHYYAKNYSTASTQYRTVPIIGVPDSVPVKRTKLSLFCSKAGSAESYDFKTVGKEIDIDYSEGTTFENNIVRGAYSPFLGLSGYLGDCGRIINIYIPNYSESLMSNYFNIRMEDQSPYYAISDRIDVDKYDSETVFYRGDCYFCLYTHRLNRNFQDLAAPTNDVIVDRTNWRTNYKPEKEPEKLGDINIGDLNAVLLGSWITFAVKSNFNLSMRDLDSSYISESLLTGNNRSFYPLTLMSVDGSYKIPESSIINTGISAQTSQKVNFVQSEVPYLKNSHQTRIAYSDISVTDAFKNGYRTFLYLSYRDYPTTYGGIMKILEVKNSLLVIFEHGIGLAPINERVMTGNGAGGNVFINTNNVLPETLNMITTDYGTQWSESVLQTPHGVYGVDTVAKKIWKYAGSLIEIISDLNIQKFLNDNITLTEYELTPIIGIRNVKTHYNAFKKDVMFTFYDSLYGYEEKAWNLCYNEFMGKFVTFYSWIPSYSANIDNIYFTFDRDSSKKIAKLDTSTQNGIVISNSIINPERLIQGEFSIKDELPQTCNVRYSIEKTLFNTNDYFDIDVSKLKLSEKALTTTIKGEVTKTNIEWFLDEHKIIPLNVKAEVVNEGIVTRTYKKQFYFTTLDYLNSSGGLLPESMLTTAFWKHGLSGIIDVKEKVKPCFWYGKQHPFEFEYVVNVNPDLLKTFDNLQILSNNVAPESFHYEIVGDSYNFSSDKLNMYVRLELTKHLYQLNGSNIIYNNNYQELLGDVKQRVLYNYDKTAVREYDEQLFGLTYGYATKGEYKDKSTLFPWYYYRQDKVDEIYDAYIKATNPEINNNYGYLAGGEIKYDSTLNQFSIINHVKAIDIKNPLQGRLRGNMLYLNDVWSVQIPPLSFVQKDETTWKEVEIDDYKYNRIPINVRYCSLINDITSINPLNTPYNVWEIDSSDWGKRKEAKLKDKYMKVKIRYKGDKLALILGVRTTFRI